MSVSRSAECRARCGLRAAGALFGRGLLVAILLATLHGISAAQLTEMSRPVSGAPIGERSESAGAQSAPAQDGEGTVGQASESAGGDSQPVGENDQTVGSATEPTEAESPPVGETDRFVGQGDESAGAGAAMVGQGDVSMGVDTADAPQEPDENSAGESAGNSSTGSRDGAAQETSRGAGESSAGR